MLRIFLVLALLCGFALSCHKPKVVIPEGPLSGAMLYSHTCARCHGRQGEGGAKRMGALPVSFQDSEVQARLKDSDIADAIKNGRRMMPPFKAVLDDEKIQLITKYVRSLQRAAQSG